MIKHIRNDNSKVSLPRALSKLGFCSRTQALDYITEGMIEVNGKLVQNPDTWVDLQRDKISSKGKSISKKRFIYIMMNKPTGIVTTRSDERSRKTVYDLLGQEKEWVFPVGRLDKETSGLLLLTNDNQLGEKLTSPTLKAPKTYAVCLNKNVTEEYISLIEKGMALNGEQLLPAKVKRKIPKKNIAGLNSSNESEYWLEITITEGKNRQIRRMFESLGYEILELIRIKIGQYQLRNLKPGEWKHLTSAEINLLQSK